MENRDLIIPARFDSGDVVAGLKSVGESGHAAGDLGRTADAASARFRQAHGSVESALQDFGLLRRPPGDEDRPIGGDPAADDPARAAVARALPGEWLESLEGPLAAAGARLGGPGARPADEAAPGSWPGDGSPSLIGGLPSRAGMERPATPPAPGHRSTPTDAESPGAGASLGSGDERDRGPSALESPGPLLSGWPVASRGLGPPGATTTDDRPGPSRRDGPTGGSGTVAAGSLLEGREILAELRQRQGLAIGGNEGGTEPGGAGRAAPEPAAGYAEWLAGVGGGRWEQGAATRRAGMAAAEGDGGDRRRDPRDFRGELESWRDGGSRPEGTDPREGIWRIRAASPATPPADDSSAEGRTTRSGRDRAGIAPGGRNPEGPLGVASTAAIERLLREQNELIRQDLQRNANPPIAAPPPLRGGGIRM